MLSCILLAFSSAELRRFEKAIEGANVIKDPPKNHGGRRGRNRSHGKSPFLIGKPSISMGHLYHGYVK